MKASIQYFITKIFTQIKNNFGNVDNTSDADKPISKAQQAEFDKINNNLSKLSYSEVAGGKNLFNKKNIITGYCINNTGNYQAKPWGCCSLPIQIKPNTSYYLSHSVGLSDWYTSAALDENKEFISTINIQGSGAVSGCITTPSNAKFIVINIYLKNIDIFQIEEGTQATDYEPYIPSVKMLASENAQQSTEMLDAKMLGWSVPEECPIQNEVNGNTFIQKVGRVDLGELYWNYAEYSGNNLFDALLPLNTVNATTNMYFTNSFVADGLNGWATLPNNHCRAYGSGIRIKDTSYTDATAFKNAMKGVYLYYELATEIKTNVDGNEAVTKVNESLSVIGKCKNLLNLILPNGVKIYTHNGVTFTDNGDGTFTANGTPSKSEGSYVIFGCSFEGVYKILGTPVNDSCIVQAYLDGIGWANSYLSGRVIEGKITNVALKINQGFTCDNLLFKPMLTTNLNATYDDFVPYTGDGDTLTADVAEIKNDLVSLKNLFSSNITGIKLNGTTLEVSFNNGTSKGKVTFDGIAEEETIIS